MSSSEEPQDRLEFETLRSRIETRESSTLTFSTVTTSASFVILSLLLSLKAVPQALYVIGALFSLIGIFYRELTVFSVDHVEGIELKSLKRR
jgi:hypothetical protein